MKTASCGLVALLVAGGLVACTTPYDPPQFKFRPDLPASFDGIAQLASQAPGQALDVVLVHGMCTHDRGWATGAIGQLSLAMGGPAEPEVAPAVTVPDTVIELHRAELATPHGAVRATAVVWSPAVAPLKAQLCFDQTRKTKLCQRLAPQAPAYPYARAWLNRDLKDELLNDCLADAIIYQGRSRNTISQQMQTALLAASTGSAPVARADLAQAAAAQTRPIAFISESLGSKVAFDAIRALQDSHRADEQEAGRRLFDRFAQIFMGANQLPILSLADQLVDVGAATVRTLGRADGSPDALAALLARRRATETAIAAQQQAPGLRVVAFTDPNDLLSYALYEWPPLATFALADVIVSNESTLFGYVERPDTAHTGYRDNRAVMRLIACGTTGCPPR